MGKEIWKDAKGYEGQYRVSNYGRVYSMPRHHPKGYGAQHNGKVLKLVRTVGRYYYVFFAGGKKKLVHRLVLETFALKVVGKNYCHHIDHNGFNNHISNLKWVTARENIQIAHKEGRWKKTKKCVRAGSRAGKRSRRYTMKEAEMIKYLGLKYTSYKIAQLLDVGYRVVRNIIINNTYKEA